MPETPIRRHAIENDTEALLRLCADDPMWTAHAEVSKSLLVRASDELAALRDLARQSNLDAMRVGKLAEDVERYSALHARLFAEKTAAQIDAENMRELLYRMLEAPTTQISPSWKEEIRPALVAPGCKTPDGCRDNGAPARTMPKDQR